MNELDVRKALVVPILQRSEVAETLQQGLEFDNCKPRMKSSIFKRIPWQSGSFFGSDDRAFLKEGVETYRMAPISSLTLQPISCLHIYSPWRCSGS